MGYGQDIDEERRMRLNLSIHGRDKGGLMALQEIVALAPNGNLGANYGTHEGYALPNQLQHAKLEWIISKPVRIKPKVV
jgi:hypothetical protein